MSGLVAVTIEGASPQEGADPIEAGEEAIDVAEYYGSEDLSDAAAIHYTQLKHSTVRATEPWTWSGLEKTIRGFAERYAELRQRPDAEDCIGKLEFWFRSNRPIGTVETETAEDISSGAEPRHPAGVRKLEAFTGLSGSELAGFCKLLRFEGQMDGPWEQRNVLTQEVNGYLVDADSDGPTQLKELIARKASSEGKANPSIRKTDLLRALGTDLDHLFPARRMVERLGGAVPREQEPEIFAAIHGANGRPVMLHAEGGVGKSIIATRIHLGLPEGSACILYDCFGNGQYRSASAYRHRHRDALVQIANELADQCLCHPLIPTSKADASDYAKAFLHRLKQGITLLRARNAGALLCIIIDAADNAEIAAGEAGESRSFARDLLREPMPEGVRLVMLCRTHRQALLDPPPNVLRIELRPFTRTETSEHLRRTFPDATEADVDEFHHLSSHNPRVQSMALTQGGSLAEILRSLGPNPTEIEDAIGSLLEAAIAKVRDAAGPLEQGQIDKVCRGLAVLRPLIPISVLSAMSGVDTGVIRSFAVDLGRPLAVVGDTIQFFDEPAETWFRDHFKPAASALATFVNGLRPLAAKSAYVASALPQLMLEAGQLEELIAVALSSEALPEQSPIERRDVELQRLQFALKASLRAKSYAEAAKLALKAGGECAAEERQDRLLQANTDLAAALLDVGRLQEIVSRRTFESGWRGSHYAYDAGLLSGRSETIGDARSRLRAAEEWLWSWSRLPAEERKEERVADEDAAEMAMAHFNVHGADACAHFLRRWRPRSLSFRAGRILAGRLLDHCRFTDLDRLAAAAGNNVYLVLAITLQLRLAGKNPPSEVAARAVDLLSRIELKDLSGRPLDADETALQAVTALVESAHLCAVSEPASLSRILTRHLPQAPRRGDYSRFGGSRACILRAYSLRAALNNEPIELLDLAPSEVREKLEKDHCDSQQAREFKEDVGALLPWHRLWANTLVGRNQASGLAAAIEGAVSASGAARGHSYPEETRTLNDIARVWFDVLSISGSADAASMGRFNEWVGSLRYPLYVTMLTHLARLCARTPSLASQALAYAERAFRITRGEREDAAIKADSYVGLARAVLLVGRADAAAYFDEAVKVASKIGDENLNRWSAMLDLGDRAADSTAPNPEAAYKLSRCAEVTYHHVARDKHFDWESTVNSIAGLCPSSSLAVLSRWRDRDFGWAERLLPEVVASLIERGDLDARDALALVGFRAHWKHPGPLKMALAASTSDIGKQTAADFAYRYMALDGQSSATWVAFREMRHQHHFEVPGLNDLIAFTERQKSASELAGAGASGASGKREERDWDAVFADIDLATADGLWRVYRRFRDLDPPWYDERFFQEACARVAAGRESEFIDAVAAAPRLSLYAFRDFLEQIPEPWRLRLPVRSALGRAVKNVCRRECMQIANSGFYESLPLRLAGQVSGLAEGEIIDVVLASLCETPETFGARRLFTLVGLLAAKLSHAGALDALSFGFDLFGSVTEPDDGDGAWSTALLPPLPVEAALAGYIWAALASPRGSVRWQAAHVVRGLCTLGRTRVLAHLIELAEASKGTPFADARLHFYDLHARQWLLIALARAAESPDVLFPHADFLTGIALEGEPHILIRKLAAEATLALFDAGLAPGQAGLRDRLESVNRSPFNVVESKRWERFSPQESGTERDGRSALHLGLDIGPYWLAPLGEHFARSQSQMERAVSNLIIREWGWPPGNGWVEDERQRRKIFKEGEAYASHSSNPRAHDLQFYLAYHAMMIIAGRLLASVPLHRNPDWPEDDFYKWLADHGVTRTDGNWLADRRDPDPLERPEWGDRGQADAWRWSVRRNDFDALLILPGDRLNLWGSWTVVEGDKEETISVERALVSRNQGEALLRALQSMAANEYIIPAVNGDEIDSGDLQLRAWVDASSLGSRLDEQDPWAGTITYPALSPARPVMDLLGLTPDFERRRWVMRIGGLDQIVLWSEVWGGPKERDDEEPANGRRLQGSLDLVLDLVRRSGMDLIINVEINRRVRHSRYHQRRSDEFEYTIPSARLFLIGPNGTIRTI